LRSHSTRDRRRTIDVDSNEHLIVCNVRPFGSPDLGTIDALARFALLAARVGAEVRVRGLTRELKDLLDLTGLGGIVGVATSDDVSARKTGR
jgi:hypothetical protein